MAISIIIPACNSSRFLAETLESVSTQERMPDEVIIVDDKSIDGTVEMARDWAARQLFPVKILHNKVPNQGIAGPAGGRQTGLQHASGDLIALLDHDDLMLPSHLRLMEQALVERPDVVLCFADATEFKERARSERSFFEGKTIEDAQYVENADTGLRLIQEPLMNTLIRGSYIPTASNLFRKNAALQAGGFQTLAGTCDDVLFFLCISRMGGAAYYPFPLARKRTHDNNLSHERHTLQNCWNHLIALRSLRDDPGKWKLSEAEIVLVDHRLNELHDEILYHASRQGVSSFMRNRAKLNARLSKNFLIGVARAMLRSTRLRAT